MRMRRIMAFVTVLCVIALLLCSQAFAGDKIATSGGWIGDYKEFERQLKYYTDECEQTFTLYLYGSFIEKIDYDCFCDTIFQNGIKQFGVNDQTYGPRHPVDFYMVYYPGKRCAYAFTSGKTDILTEDEKELLDKALVITSDMDGNDEEVIKQVYDYLCNNVTYYYGDNEIEDNCHNAIGALLNGEAVCDGYADAFYLMCSLKGIEAGYVSGVVTANTEKSGDYTKARKHGWNIVKLDDKWYMVDVMNGDATGAICYLTYLIGTEMMEKHYSWTAVLPVQVSEDSYHRVENPFVEVRNWLDVRTEISKAKTKGLERLTLTGLNFVENDVYLRNLMSSVGITNNYYFPTEDSCEILLN